ncbi:YkgJ family cysteine cluster protein [Planctomycetota bacterium]
MNEKPKWYAAGLAFECTLCGECCSGPDEGVIWVSKHEISLIAEHLGITEDALREKYLRRIATRNTIIEAPDTRDCIFLKTVDGEKVCGIYAVRPNQCRTWPFWSNNLQSPHTWNATAQDCPGINRGKNHSFEEIERLRKQKRWWDDDPS